MEDKEYRRIANLWWDEEIKRLNEEVYTPLESEHHGLRDYLENLRKRNDPICEIIETQFKIQTMNLHCVGLGFEKGDSSQEVRDLDKRIKKLEGTHDYLAKTLLPFHLTTSLAIKLVSYLNGTRIGEVVQNSEYRDTVSKTTIPKRKSAEKVVKASQLHEELRVDITRDLITLLKEVGTESGLTKDEYEQMLEEYNALPNPEDLERVQKAVREYKMRELDRIYRA